MVVFSRSGRLVTGGCHLDKEGPHCLLEGGDGAVGVWKGGLEMRENLRLGRPVWGLAGSRLARRRLARRRVRWWVAGEESGADLALPHSESSPNALPGSFAQPRLAGVDRGENAACDGVLQEPPQGAGVQAEASYLGGNPDADGPAAATTCIAIAAKEAPSADCFVLRIGVIVAT